MQQTMTGRRILWALLALVLSLTASVVEVSPASAGDDPRRSDKAKAEVREQVVATEKAPDRAARPRVKPSAEKVESLEVLQKRIAQYVDEHGTKFSFASYIDSRTGEIVLDTDAPAELVADLTTADSLQGDALESAQVRRTTTSDLWHRRDDIQPYWGGGGITSGGGICSAGYAVEWIWGIEFSVTAGHCFADGATVLTESGNNTYGSVLWRRLPTVTGDAMDAELVYGGNFAGRIFTGGVTSTSSAPVVAAGTAYTGYTNYCHSGRTTGENCGHTATSISGQVCTQSGCKSPVIVFTGGTLSQGGDSGSPFYAKDASGGVWIRGNVIAGSSATAYAQPWPVIQAEYGVSIVTG
jgi:hypothetical protein